MRKTLVNLKMILFHFIILLINNNSNIQITNASFLTLLMKTKLVQKAVGHPFALTS